MSTDKSKRMMGCRPGGFAANGRYRDLFGVFAQTAQQVPDPSQAPVIVRALDTVADDGMRQNLAFFDGNSDGASTPKNWSESSRYSRGRPGRPRVMRLREQ